MLNRRGFLTGFGTVGASLLLPGLADAANWGINATSQGLIPNSVEDQGKLLQHILETAAIERKSVFLEPGNYRVSDVTLPEHTVIQGVPGGTTLQYAGGKHFLFSQGAKQLTLSGLKLDGRLLPIENYAEAALRIEKASKVDIDNCHITNSAQNGLEILHSSGIIHGSRIDTAVGAAGILAYENSGLMIDGNLVEDCANGGILVHRWQRGPDNSIVINNRVRKISSVYGGTGQWGNGINTYLADGIIVSGNHVSDCAFSTIRSNSCSNIQISDNTCIRAGETSIYSEFAHDGAKITSNIVDGGVTGISMANFNEGGRLSVCANNIVRNIHDNVPYKDDAHVQGIGISAEAEATVTGNTIEQVKNFGILLGWGPYLRNVSVNANVVRSVNTGMYVSVVEGIGNVNITNNMFSKVRTQAIAGYRWHDAVTGDLINGAPQNFPTLRIAGNLSD